MSSQNSSNSANKENIIVNYNSDNFTFDPSLLKDISDFEKIAKIGVGGSAIKKADIDENTRNHFVNETKILSLFHHPTINSLLGFNEDKEGSCAYVFMPYYSNGDLLKMINCKEKAPERFDITQKYIIIYGIAVGMAILHKNNFIHRDIKPSNILLSDELEPFINKFSLSIHVDQEDGIYEPETMCGTPIYMAPEFFKECSVIYGKKADVYSYGLTCYHILAGFPPFNNIKYIQLFQLLPTGHRPAFPSDFNSSLQGFIESCWSQDPEDRPNFIDIVRVLGSKEFIDEVESIDYKRFREYQKKVTPNEFINDNEAASEELDKNKKHRSSSRKSKHSRHSHKENESIIVNYDSSNKTIDPSLYKDISDFEKIDRIGKGKFGIVFRYKNKTIGEFVAIKKIFNIDNLNVIQIPSLFHHPTLNSILGVYKHDEEEIDIIEPYYPNGDLLTMIGKKNDLPEAFDMTQKYIILYGSAVGMAILHKNNFVHLNIEPSNILLSDQLEPSISGFSCSIHINRDDGNGCLEGVFGTPSYIAPEIMLAELNQDGMIEINCKMADVYSYSMFCYHVLTNLIPFSNCNSIAQIYKALKSDEKPKFPSDFNPTIRKFIEECWNKDPTKRPTFIDIVQKLGSKEFIDEIGLIDYKRFRKYQKKVTPNEFIQNESKKHRSSSSKKSKHSSNHTNKENENIIINYDPKNFAIDQSFYKKLSDFEEIGKLAITSFGNIRKYKNKTTGEIVAIKELDNLTDYDYLNEIKVLSLFHHPTLNSFCGFIENKEESHVYTITPYYSNGDLMTVINRNKSLDFTQKYIILYGIAIGISILHRNNFIHRDLKTSSILLSDQFEPVVNSFGLSIHIDRDDGIYHQSQFMGSPLFMSPESISLDDDNNEINGKKADVYSYSITCYHVLTNLLPFKGMSMMQLYRTVQSGKRPDFPSDFNPTLRKFIETCWNQNPEERPSFIDIVQKLGSKEFINEVGSIDYKRFRKYQKKVTPNEFIQKSEKIEANNKNEEEEEEITINIDFTNFSVDPSLVKSLSNFKKIGFIGGGGFGKVYKYQEIETGQIYAVKRMLSDIETDIPLQREITISSKLIHPTLQSLNGVNIDEDNISLFTYFCSQGDLNNMIEKEMKKEHPPEWNFTQKYIVLYGIAAGLYFLHRNKFIHRDIKPGNILLNDDLEPLITDFGASKNLDPTNSRLQSQVIGTLQFMAPELFLSEDFEYDGRKADVYAFAILCYQLLTGIIPFKQNISQMELLKLLSNEKRPDFPDDFNPEIKKFIENCWKQDPEERYSFNDVLNEMGSKEFIEKVGGIDVDKFKKYQQKVVTKKFKKF